MAGVHRAATTHLHPDFGGPPYGFPYNVVDNTHPTYSVTFLYASESDAGPYPVGADTSFENGSDRHALIINRDTCTLYELYNVSGSGSSWSAGSGAIFPLGSNALRPSGWTSADAAGLPIFPGLVRWDEVQAGAINHAIRFTVQQTDQSFLWPARHQAGSAANPALPPMGARFRLKGSYDISHFSAQTRVILLAMQQASQFVAVDESTLMLSANSAAVKPACPTTGGRASNVPPLVCAVNRTSRGGAPPRVPALPTSNPYRWLVARRLG